MSRLVWRIFFAFWGVLLVALLCTVAFNALVARDSAAARAQLLEASVDALALQAQRKFDADGLSGLRDWLTDQQRQLDAPLWIIDAEGVELLNRRVPPFMRAMAIRGAVPPPGPDGRRRRWLPQPGLIRGADATYWLFAADRERPPRGAARVLGPEARRVFPLVLMVLSGFACLWLARYLTQPIQQFRRAGQLLGQGDLKARVGPAMGARKDEFGALARDFDRMAERVEDLLDSRQRLLRDVSHELRSPLARLQTAVELLRQRGTGGSSERGDQQYLDRIEAEAEQLNAMIGQILTYARLDTATRIERQPADLCDVLNDVVENAAFEAQPLGKQIELQAPQACVMNIDAELVRSAFDNVVRNALQHGHSCVTVECIAAAEAVVVTVRDDGPGARPQDLPRLFEPFFTQAPSNSAAGHGAGIGLAIARRAVELHNGSIAASNAAEGSGLVVTVRLPR